MSDIERVPIHLKTNLTIREGRSIQQHRHQQNRQNAPISKLPVCPVCWDKEIGETKGI